MKNLFFSIQLFFVMQIVLLSMASAQISPPERINYQGVLRDISGAPLEGDVSITFRFYDDPAAGTLLWEEVYNSLGYPPEITVNNGLFTVALGDSTHRNGGSETDFKDVFSLNTDVYLAVQVDTDTEMTPRIKVIASPYTLNADNLDGRDSNEFLDTSGTAQTKTGQLTVSGGIDLGPGADDDLSASDVTTLTNGNSADALHTHTNVSGSDTLDGLDSSQFLRSDVSDTFEGATLTIGSASSVQLPDGSATSPSISFVNDADVGLYRPNNDQIAVTTAGSQQLVIDGYGNLAAYGALRAGNTTPTSYNHFGSSGTTVSGDMANTGDLFLQNDIEVSGQVYLGKYIFMEGSNSAGSDGDQNIYFYNDDSRTGEYLRWDDSGDDFDLSAGLNLSGVIQTGSMNDSSGYNYFNNLAVSDPPVSDDITGTGDVYIQDNVEIGSNAYLSKNLYMEGNASTGADGDQTIFFYNGGNREAEAIRWDDSSTYFSITDALIVDGPISTGISSALHSYNQLGHGTVPSSDNIASDDDVFIDEDLEIGRYLYLSKRIYMEGSSSTGLDGDQTIYFYNNDSRTAESIYWDDSDDHFVVSDGMRIQGPIQINHTSPTSYNHFGSGGSPNGYMTNSSDVFIDEDLQINGTVFLDNGTAASPSLSFTNNWNTGFFYHDTAIAVYTVIDGAAAMTVYGDRTVLHDRLFVGGNRILINYYGTDEDQNIYFFEDGYTTGEYIRWDDSEDRFAFSDDVYVSGSLTCTGTKPFIQNHPERSDLSIIYTALEGDEAATYTRGSAVLEHGEAQISLGETFQWVTNPDVGLTAYLTPRGECSDLYVRSLTTNTLTVAQTDGKQDNCPFDYIVLGLRIGYEQNSVLAHRSIESNVPNPEYWQQYYSDNPEFQFYNPLSRFQQMHSNIHGKQAAESDLTRTLRCGIGEFDPDNNTVDSAIGESTNRPELTDENYVRDETSDIPVHPQRASSPQSQSAHLSGSFQIYDSVDQGAVLVLDPTLEDTVHPCDREADPLVVGLAGTAVQDNSVDEGRNVSVVYQGIAYCKVDATYESINIGYLLVTSPTPGHAMQDNVAPQGTIIGKALQSLESGTGLIKIMLMIK